MEQPISARFDSYFARSRFLLSLTLPHFFVLELPKRNLGTRSITISWSFYLNSCVAKVSCWAVSVVKGSYFPDETQLHPQTPETVAALPFYSSQQSNPTIHAQRTCQPNSELINYYTESLPYLPTLGNQKSGHLHHWFNCPLPPSPPQPKLPIKPNGLIRRW